MEIKIPIEIVELEDNSFHIIVSLQIGSIEGDFIIDTGASVTVIDKLTPFSYEPLDDVSEINSGGVCGEINEVQLVNITALQIDNHTIENIHAAVIDLQYVNSLYDNTCSAGLPDCWGVIFSLGMRRSLIMEIRS